jgi:hypothetical protein
VEDLSTSDHSQVETEELVCFWHIRKLEDIEAARDYCAVLGRPEVYLQSVHIFC